VRRRAASCSFPAATLSYALLLCGCGGGGASSYNPPPPPPNPLTIATASLPNAMINQAYTTTLVASGGIPPYRWSTPSSQPAPPPGLALASNGTISGVPTQAGNAVLGVAVTDSAANSAQSQLSLVVETPIAFVPSAALPDGNVGVGYQMGLYLQGGSPPYTVSLASTSAPLPPGLTFDPTQEVLGGVPTKPGAYSFTLQASDSSSPALKTSQTFTLNIQNKLVFTGFNLPQGIVNFAYSQSVPVAGGTLPYHFGLLPQSVLPAGLSLDGNSGLITGKPSATGYSTFWVQVIDSSPQPATISEYLALNVNLPVSINTKTLPDSARGIGYFSTIAVFDGVPPYTASISSGALPDGMSISNLDLTGSPSKDGLFNFTVKVSDSYSPPSTATQDFQIRISDPMNLSGPGQVTILYNQSYSTTFPATGGFLPYTWSIDRTPPPGFTFDPVTGTLSGTPNGPSFTSPNISVHDSSNPPLTATYYNFVLDVTPKLVIYTTLLPTVATGSTVFLQPIVMGGAANYQWSISPGSLPPGTSLNTFSNGNAYFSGSPTTAGVYTFSLNISDGNSGNLHQATSQQLTWTVKDRGQMARNDTLAQATPISNIALLASISPFSDPSSSGPDVDVYSMSAAPGSLVQFYAAANNEFIQPPETNSLQPVLEVVDSKSNRYQTCAPQAPQTGTVYNLPCINGLPGTSYISGPYFTLQVPGSGTTPVTIYVRVSDARGDARPDFIYTLNVIGVN
jgi:hypothetical protein